MIYIYIYIYICKRAEVAVRREVPAVPGAAARCGGHRPDLEALANILS